MLLAHVSTRGATGRTCSIPFTSRRRGAKRLCCLRRSMQADKLRSVATSTEAGYPGRCAQLGAVKRAEPSSASMPYERVKRVCRPPSASVAQQRPPPPPLRSMRMPDCKRSPTQSLDVRPAAPKPPACPSDVFQLRGISTEHPSSSASQPELENDAFCRLGCTGVRVRVGKW